MKISDDMLRDYVAVSVGPDWMEEIVAPLARELLAARKVVEAARERLEYDGNCRCYDCIKHEHASLELLAAYDAACGEGK
jgi:hypothetical protein